MIDIKSLIPSQKNTRPRYDQDFYAGWFNELYPDESLADRAREWSIEHWQILWYYFNLYRDSEFGWLRENVEYLDFVPLAFAMAVYHEYEDAVIKSELESLTAPATYTGKPRRSK